MTVPHYVNEYASEIRAIKPGWYGMESNGKLSSDLTGITQAEEQFSSVAPWLAHAIKCPECGGEHVRLCTRLDEYGRVWRDNSCETCGHKLSSEEMGRHVVN